MELNREKWDEQSYKEFTEYLIEIKKPGLAEFASKEYYVMMQQAWLVSVAFIKQREKTLAFLRNNELDKTTQNKAVQKIRESNRVSKEDKEMLVFLKRK